MAGIFDPGIFDSGIFDTPGDTETGSLTADAVVRKTQTGSLTANAVVKRSGQTGSFTVDAFITEGGSFTADAVIRKTQGASFTEVDLCWDGDVESGGVTGSIAVTAGQWIYVRRIVADIQWSGTSMWGVVLQIGTYPSGPFKNVFGWPSQSTSGGVNYHYEWPQDWITLPSWVPSTGSYGSVRAIAQSTALGAYNGTEAVSGGDHAVYGAWQAPSSGTVTIHGWFDSPGDEILHGARSGYDACVRVAVSDLPPPVFLPLFFTVDAEIVRGAQLRLNAVLRRAAAGSFTADAVLNRTGGSFTADAYIQLVFQGSVLADAVVRRSQPRSITAHAVLQRSHTGSFTADACIATGGSLTADAVLQRLGQAQSFTANAWIFAPVGSVHPTPIVSILVDGLDVTEHVVFEDATFTMLVNGAVGTFSFRVRDDAHQFAFVSGVEVTLDIYGRRRFGGYLSQPRRMFAFPVEDTSDPDRPSRFHVLTGVDYNILFAKRIVYDKVDPANLNLRSWPKGSHDDVVIKYVFDHYTDLAADGATYDGVTHVGSPNPDRVAVIASGSLKFGEAMHEINRLISGVFYFDPYKDLKFVDVDIPDASKSLSDRPGGGSEIGYREFTHTENGSNLVNDAMVWGAGLGSRVMAYGRVQDAPSQALHGLWQYGEYTTQLFRQTSVDQRASTVVYGTPQSKRGGKDDQVSWAATTYDPAFFVGQKVVIESEVWDVADVVPIRRMTVTFPVKDRPRFQLVLSHEIDEPWNLFEFYFPRFGIDLPGNNTIDFQRPTLPPFDADDWAGWVPHYYQGQVFAASDIDLGNYATTYDPNGGFIVHDTEYTYHIDYEMSGDLAGAYSGSNAGLNIDPEPFAPGGARIWTLAGMSGAHGHHTYEGTLDSGATSSGFRYLATGWSPIAGNPIAITMTFWFDPIGWDPGTQPLPSPGQQVFNDTVDETPDGIRTIFTLSLGKLTGYVPGTLEVTVDGSPAAITELDPTAGTFEFVTPPAPGTDIRATYQVPLADFTAGGGQTVIQLASKFVSGSSQVWRNKLFQRPGIEYTEQPDLGTITFTDPLNEGDSVHVIYEENGPI